MALELTTEEGCKITVNSAGPTQRYIKRMHVVFPDGDQKLIALTVEEFKAITFMFEDDRF